MGSRVLLLLSAIAACGGCYRSHQRPEGAPTGDAGLDAAAPDAGRADGGEEPGPDASRPSDPRELERLCRMRPVERLDVEVAFPARAPRCPWDVGDNLSPAQGTAAARIEQTIVAISDTDLLCALELDSGVSGSPLRYDDNFFLLLGDVVLASSDEGLVARLPREGRFVRWDWAAIRGAPMAVSDNRPYCLGADEGRARCTIPRTEERGTARIELDASLVAELIVRATELTFTLVTLGDNDPELDCAHDGFRFRLTGSILR